MHPPSVKLKYPGKQRSHERPVTPGLQWHWPPNGIHVVPFSVPVLLQEQAARKTGKNVSDKQFNFCHCVTNFEESLIVDSDCWSLTWIPCVWLSWQNDTYARLHQKPPP